MVLQWFWLGFSKKSLVFPWLCIGSALVSFGFSLDLLVFITRVLDCIVAVLGSQLVLDWFYSGFGQVVLLWHTQERVAGAAQKCPRRSRAQKNLQNDCFPKLFVRVSGCASACVSSPISSDARNEEDIILSGFL